MKVHSGREKNSCDLNINISNLWQIHDVMYKEHKITIMVVEAMGLEIKKTHEVLLIRFQCLALLWDTLMSRKAFCSGPKDA